MIVLTFWYFSVFWSLIAHGWFGNTQCFSWQVYPLRHTERTSFSWRASRLLWFDTQPFSSHLPKLECCRKSCNSSRWSQNEYATKSCTPKLFSWQFDSLPDAAIQSTILCVLGTRPIWSGFASPFPTFVLPSLACALVLGISKSHTCSCVQLAALAKPRASFSRFNCAQQGSFSWVWLIFLFLIAWPQWLALFLSRRPGCLSCE